jgi:dolichyl-phosphate-mannose-protein mannosyltransferase
MVTTAVSQGSLRQRNPGTKKKSGSPVPDDGQLESLVKPNKTASGIGSELDYKIALAIITVLAFISRFWGISHPNEVVFDEVHFGKVGAVP